MSVSKPAKSFLTKSNSFTRCSPRDLRLFHSSSAACARRRPRFTSIRADDMEILRDLQTSQVKLAELDAATVKRLNKHAISPTTYSPSEEELVTWNELAKQTRSRFSKDDSEALNLMYTRSQVAAIRSAEKTIDDRTMLSQGQPRLDGARIKYTDDDFTTVDYVYDRQKKNTIAWPLKRGEDITVKSEDQLYMKLAEFIQASGKKYVNTGRFDPTEDMEERKKEGWLEEMEVDWEKFATDPRTLFNAPNEETYRLLEEQHSTAVAAELPRLTDKISKATSSDLNEEEDPRLKKLQLRTGWSEDDLKKIKVKVLHVRRVKNQTRMGKVMSYSLFAVAGNEDGLVGYGHGKSTEMRDALAQAKDAATRSIRPIPRYENRTIYGEVYAKVGATEVTLTAKHPGYGNRAMHYIFEICRAAGIDDIRASVPRSRNPMNIIKATIECLHKQRLPEDVARGRGRKMVDVRSVYYGGNTM